MTTTDIEPDTDIDGEVDSEVPAGPGEYRSARVADVSTKRREISVIAVPYDEDADIWERDRHYVESFHPNAFRGVQRRTRKVTVNREHDPHHLVGKVFALEPAHPDGLHATMRMTKGLTLADETLALAADDVLGASISFSPLIDQHGDPGEEWSRDGSRRRINRAYLHHIALVAEPAYEGAGVLAVRHAGTPSAAASPTIGAVVVSATPWLDRIRADRTAERYGFQLTP